jgi:uncharacterized protein (DUF4415 family)
MLAHFRASGPGWRSRINATLRKTLDKAIAACTMA